MKRVINFQLNPNKKQQIILGNLTYAASKLWNVANYERKNWSKQSGIKYPNWYEQKKKLKSHFWYKNLPSQTAQELLKQLDCSWKSFYRLLQTGGIKNPKPPKYKHQPFNVRYLNNGFELLNKHTLQLSIPKQLRTYLSDKFNITDKYLLIDVPVPISGAVKIVEIIPEHNKYSVNIIVELLDTKAKEDNAVYMSIDLGINNLITAYINTGKTYIISGRQLLSINRYFDKEIAYYSSISDSQQAAKGIKYPKQSKRVQQLYAKRRKQINHVLHTATKSIIDIAEQNNVCKIIIGDITNIREDNNMGKVNNQKFHKWPFKRIKDCLMYKAENKGIAVEMQEESYTSQCSPYTPQVSKKYAKKSNRKYRGLYKNNVNTQIFNADCVGAYNILRKYLCRMEKSIPAVVGLDTPRMYHWNSQGFFANPKLSISMEM
ncbi:MAG TPA: transposase [Clostridiaceae bacterium]|jgi:putative transposase|nr:transposase [Clostridiaceae bacterium]